MIREWKKSDNREIVALESECFSDPWNGRMLDGLFSEPNFYGLVWVEDDKIVGYIGTSFDLWDAEILLIAVDKDYRRRKIAETLMTAVIDRYERLGKEHVFLEVRVSNEAAQALYKKLGFVKIGVREKYYEYTEDALVLSKALRGAV